MWIIVGLGNPGRRYARTRHNLGFMVVDEIAERYGIELRKKDLYLIGKGSIEDSSVVLMEPLTFMNLSGLAVRGAMTKNNVQPERLVIVHDDIDMETGRLKMRKKGSSGGHRGIESIIESIGTKEFIRVKIGVGREEGVAAEDYVLRKFRKDELPLIKEAVVRAVDAIETIIINGIDKAMNSFN
ncbi:MAG TPA: aminoacyl-tRNA hydrolase [Thermodesulfovibrionales bacterium]|nr:aminoacyl-tRNA hydrolase [Thermodesulfovibrionales bacterium]